MSNDHDFLPRREADFAEYCGRVMEVMKVGANSTAFGWDAEDVAELVSALHIFLTAWAAYRDSNSTENLITKKNAIRAAESVVRKFVNSSVRHNRKMRAEDKFVFNVRQRAQASASPSVVNSYPETEADTSIMRQVGIHFRDNVTKKRGKPRGIHGAEIRWAVLDHVPASVEELSEADFDTASPFILRFDESDRGKRLYFCLRWETNANVKGPFGSIGSAIIP